MRLFKPKQEPFGTGRANLQVSRTSYSSPQTKELKERPDGFTSHSPTTPAISGQRAENLNSQLDDAENESLSPGDILDQLGEDELREILYAEASKSQTIADSLSTYYKLTRQRKYVTSFKEFLDIMLPREVYGTGTMPHWGNERTRLESAITELLDQIGPFSSWSTKVNALAALRTLGKAMERLGDPRRFQDGVRRCMKEILGLLSSEDRRLLLRQYGSLEVLSNFYIDLRCDADPEWMPPWPTQEESDEKRIARYAEYSCRLEETDFTQIMRSVLGSSAGSSPENAARIGKDDAFHRSYGRPPINLYADATNHFAVKSQDQLPAELPTVAEKPPTEMPADDNTPLTWKKRNKARRQSSSEVHPRLRVMGQPGTKPWERTST